MASMESEDSCTTEVAEVESEDPEQPSAVRSLLDQLKCPTASELSRKRKIHSNPPPIGLTAMTQHLLEVSRTLLSITEWLRVLNKNYNSAIRITQICL